MNSPGHDVLNALAADAVAPTFSLLGESAVMRAAREQIRKLAASSVPVAIYGESGSGKELAARDIHALSARSHQAFVPVNCGAIPESLMESEFFGVRRGAFTGATEDRPGFFQAAHCGTLFLDEIAELPLSMQVKLLRVIQEGKVRKLGSAREEPVDVRILCATHLPLAQAVQQRTFRQDLYYRLNVIELRLPSLRERREDIPLLCEALLRRQIKRIGPVTLTAEAVAALRAYDFPGNVRELENMLERAAAFASQGMVGAEDLMPGSLPLPSCAAVSCAEPPFTENGSGAASTSSLLSRVRAFERQLIIDALREARFRRARAAERLGISLRQLRYRMQRLDIHEPD
ncbi:MAG: sigma-54 interaction domain-containing protein [Oxalobacteraceae bacterium]